MCNNVNWPPKNNSNRFRKDLAKLKRCNHPNIKIFQLTIRNLPHSPGSIGPSHPILTTRQKETLFWLSKGKSICETSLILDLSVPTIGKHLRLARKNLSAKTTIEAMAKVQTNSQFLNLVPSY